MKRNLSVLIFAMVFPTAMALLYFLAMASGDGGANPAQQLGYTLGKGFQFLLPVVYVWWLTGAFPRPSKPRWEGMGIAIGFGLLVFGVMLALYFLILKGSPLFASTPALIESKLKEFGLTGRAAFILFAVFVSLIHSILEEYYWRWFVFKGLREHTTFGKAVLWSSLAFMAHHVVVLYVYLPGYFWQAAVPFSLGIAVGGAVWAWLYEKTGNIYAAWLSHAVIDAAIFVVGYDLLTG
mgnify:FL=1